MRVGIVGYGVVGAATASIFPEVVIYDPPKGFAGSEALAECGVVFVCLPTPTVGGHQDLSAIRQALDQIAPVLRDQQVVAIRSTVLPGVTRRLQQEYPRLLLASNPEFLRAHCALNDTRQPARVVIGADHPEARQLLVSAYSDALTDVRDRLVLTDVVTAEVIKYAANCYLAMKISFFNELYEVCDSLEANYPTVRMGMEMDPRIGAGDEAIVNPSRRGYDDECLPKDVDAFLTFLVGRDLPAVLLEATARVNGRVRCATLPAHGTAELVAMYAIPKQ